MGVPCRESGLPVLDFRLPVTIGNTEGVTGAYRYNFYRLLPNTPNTGKTPYPHAHMAHAHGGATTPKHVKNTGVFLNTKNTGVLKNTPQNQSHKKTQGVNVFFEPCVEKRNFLGRFSTFHNLPLPGLNLFQIAISCPDVRPPEQPQIQIFLITSLTKLYS